MVSEELINEVIEKRRNENACPRCGDFPLNIHDEYMEDTGYTLTVFNCSECMWEEGDDPKEGFIMDCPDCDGSGTIFDPYRTTGESVIDCYFCSGSGKLEN